MEIGFLLSHLIKRTESRPLTHPPLPRFTLISRIYRMKSYGLDRLLLSFVRRVETTPTVPVPIPLYLSEAGGYFMHKC
jgi:hypothetical protein